MQPCSCDPPEQLYHSTSIGLPSSLVKFIELLELFPDIPLKAGINSVKRLSPRRKLQNSVSISKHIILEVEKREQLSLTYILYVLLCT